MRFNIAKIYLDHDLLKMSEEELNHARAYITYFSDPNYREHFERLVKMKLQEVEQKKNRAVYRYGGIATGHSYFK